MVKDQDIVIKSQILILTWNTIQEGLNEGLYTPMKELMVSEKKEQQRVADQKKSVIQKESLKKTNEIAGHSLNVMTQIGGPEIQLFEKVTPENINKSLDYVDSKSKRDYKERQTDRLREG